ncbi:unnamed protein product [Caenorhabditis bovis]|uniref:Uncharacterized protein n=1 Tax=Caenorhabditis bovis TaxID=2654633 RepID=A0A8S1EZ25_9PELO|nr:unnamed protein product [Caenorhabditis bovis]
MLAKSVKLASSRQFLIRNLFYSTTNSSNECYLERLQGKDEGISLIHMNRAARKNSLGKTFMKQFRQILDDVKFDNKTRVIILKSAVPGTFCTGADLKERKEMAVDEVPKFVDSLRNSFTDLEKLPQPVIAAIDGFALGGGLELALACDIRVASKTSKLGLVETKWALIPGAGGSQRLSRVIGPAKAKELIFTAEIFDGEQAAQLGVVNHVADDSLGKSLEIARKIIPRGPIAVRMAKLAINLGSQTDINSALTVEQQCYAQIVPTKDRIEGLKAFAEKREPIYKGE